MPGQGHASLPSLGDVLRNALRQQVVVLRARTIKRIQRRLALLARYRRVFRALRRTTDSCQLTFIDEHGFIQRMPRDPKLDPFTWLERTVLQQPGPTAIFKEPR